MLNIVSVCAEGTEGKVVIGLVSELIDMLSTEIHCRIQLYLKIVFVHVSNLKGAFFHTSALLPFGSKCALKVSFITVCAEFSIQNTI